MTRTPVQKATALIRALELVEARINYNIALKEEIEQSTTQEFLARLKNNPDASNVLAKCEENTARLEETVINLKKGMIHSTNFDIKKLQELAEMMKAFSSDESLALTLAYRLWRDFKSEEFQVKLSRQARKQQGRGNPTDEYEDANSEYYTYKEILEIFNNGELFGPQEKDFLDLYTTFQQIKDNLYVRLDKSRFGNLLQKHRHNINTIKDGLKKLSEFHSEFVKTTFDELATAERMLESSNAFIKNQMETKPGEIEYIKNPWEIEYISELQDAYVGAYKLTTVLGEMSALLSKVTEEDDLWKSNQYKLQQGKLKLEELKQKQQLKPKQVQKHTVHAVTLKKAAAPSPPVKKAAAPSPPTLKKEAVQMPPVNKETAIENPKPANPTAEAQLKQEQEQEMQRIAERQQRHEKWKDRVEKQKAENAAAKQTQRKAFTNALYANKIVSNDGGVLESRFQLTAEAIKKHEDIIIDLFKGDAFNYEKAKIFIKQLRGTLVQGNKGSSHYKIIFDGATHGSIVRPHAGETDVRGENLRIFRNTLRSIVPEKFHYDLHMTNTRMGSADTSKPSSRPRTGSGS